MQNYRAMPIHSFGLQVQCGGCQAFVTQVAAVDIVAAQRGEGRCAECLAKEPIIVEAPAKAETVADRKPAGSWDARAEAAAEAESEGKYAKVGHIGESTPEPEAPPEEQTEPEEPEAKDPKRHR